MSSCSSACRRLKEIMKDNGPRRCVRVQRLNHIPSYTQRDKEEETGPLCKKKKKKSTQSPTLLLEVSQKCTYQPEWAPCRGPTSRDRHHPQQEAPGSRNKAGGGGVKRLRGEWGSEPEGKKNQTNKTKGKKLNLQPRPIKKAPDARRFPTRKARGNSNSADFCQASL